MGLIHALQSKTETVAFVVSLQQTTASLAQTTSSRPVRARPRPFFLGLYTYTDGIDGIHAYLGIHPSIHPSLENQERCSFVHG